MLLDTILAWIPLAAAGIAAAAQIGGSIMSAQGAAGANAANVQMQQTANAQQLAAQGAQHEQNTAFMEDSQAFGREERQYAENFSAHQAELARGFASQEAATARDVQNQFQERMAGTQYQRAMADMKAAGLNPILAYQQGGNAAPSGSSAQASGPSPTSSAGSGGMASAAGPPSLRAAQVMNDKEFIGRGIANAVQSALQVSKGLEEIDQIKETNKLTQEKQQTERNLQRNLHVDSAKKTEETFKTNAEIDNAKATTALIKAQSSTAAQESGNMSKYGKREAPETIERILRMIQGRLEQDGYNPLAK